MWSYDGWNSLNFVAEELKSPEKTFPRVLLTAIPFVTVLYVLTNISYLTVLSPQKLVNSPAVGVSFGATYSQTFAVFIILCVSISIRDFNF